MPTTPTQAPRTNEVGPSVLDCTLRDGGYYTNWDYPEDILSSYFRAVAVLPVSIVEVGYISKPVTQYRGRFHYLNASSTARIREKISPNQQLAAMVDAKSHAIEDVRYLLRSLGPSLDLVRFAVSPHDLGHGADLAEEVRSLGFDVGVNIMYLSRWWSDPGRLSGLERVLQTADFVALVDSYGACEPPQVAQAVRSLSQVSSSTTLGFHGHDNLGLALANSIAAMDAGASVIDGTISGMGRGAGNTSTQALLVRESARRGTRLDLDALASVDKDFDQLKREFQWGTSLPYLVSGASDLPQRDVMDWLAKNRYSMESILRALRGDTSEGLDNRSFPPLTSSAAIEELVILGGGSSVRAHKDALAEYVQLSRATVLHASQRHLGILSSIGRGQVVCLTGDDVMPVDPADIDDCVAAYAVPEKPRLAGTVPVGTEAKSVEVAPFALDDSTVRIGPVPDIAPLALALGVVLTLGVRKVSLVGFDGYSLASPAQQALAAETSVMVSEFMNRHPEVTMVSLTPNPYNVPADSIYARISLLAAPQEERTQ